MDTTITGIGAVVVAELRAVGYMESTVGQYGKTIKALTDYAERRGAHLYTPALGAGFAEGDPISGPVAMRLGVGGSWSTVERTGLG